MASRFLAKDELANNTAGIDQYWSSPLVSLETATCPLQDLIPNIGELVTEAKRKCIKSPHGLTHDESAAIYLYTMETGPMNLYRILNRMLRTKDKENASHWFLYLKLFATGLKKLPSYSGNVWRIVEGDVAERYTKDTQVCWWAFSSCTKAISILKRFFPQNGTGGTVFMIECVNGKNISPYSAYNDEDEILLMSGTTVAAMDEALPMAEMRVVHLQEVSIQTNLFRPFSSPNIHSNSNTSSTFEKNNKTASSHAIPKSATAKSSSGNSTVKKTCPHCSTTLILSESYRCGMKINCCHCKKSFNEVTCPLCHKSNIWKNCDYHAGRNIKCANCNGEFQHLNCPYCKKEAFWRSPNKHTSGLRTCCSSCQQYYRALNCPSCHATQYFKNDNYKAGSRYRCSSCDKVYQAINCPHCSQINIWKNGDHKPGFKTTCHNCKKYYQHVNCPQCSEPCIWEKANRIPGYQVTCPKCQNKFQHLNCPHCDASNFWTNGEYQQRSRVRCCQCEQLYQHVTCPHCKGANYFSKADLAPNDRVRCHDCGNSF